MAIDNAKALWAKLLSDSDLKQAFEKVTSKKEFEELAAKHGYTCSLEEFQAAEKDAKESNVVSDEVLSQVSGGLSMVGVDYTFTAVKCNE